MQREPSALAFDQPFANLSHSGREIPPPVVGGPMADSTQHSPAVQQFLHLLPLTLEIAGLPRGEAGKYFNEDQMDLRVQAIRKAYKHVQKLAKDLTATQ
jgi:hypothetical protein